MSYEESEEVEENNTEEDKDNNKEEKIIKPKMKEKDIFFTSLNEMGMSISKMEKLDSLGLSRSTIKRKRRQIKEKGGIQRLPGSRRKKILDEEKEIFIIDSLTKNPFLSITKLTTLLKKKFENFEINEITIRRALALKEFKWKSPLQRVKYELDKKITRLQFWKYNRNRNWNNVFSQMNPVFI